jgi:hypothetical protein
VVSWLVLERGMVTPGPAGDRQPPRSRALRGRCWPGGNFTGSSVATDGPLTQSGPPLSDRTAGESPVALCR